jgi:hypothetical protein
VIKVLAKDEVYFNGCEPMSKKWIHMKNII